MKKDFKEILKNRKLIYLLGAVLIAAVFYGVITSTLHASSSYVPEDKVGEMNEERSQVYVDGQGYQLQEYVTQKKQQEEQKPEIRKPVTKPQVTRPPVTRQPIVRRPIVRRSVTGSNTTTKKQTTTKKETKKKQDKKETKKSSKKSEKKPKKEEVSEDPVITISLDEGEVVTGTVKKFTVKAVSFDGDEIPAGQITVKMNDERLLENGADTYVGTVIDGENTINVKATDDEGRKSELTRRFNGNTEAPPEEIGELEVTVTAKKLGIDVVVPKKSVKIYENEQLSDVVKRYLNESEGITGKDIGNGYYELGFIKKKGIIDEIPDWKLEELETQGISYAGDDRDTLGLNDFGPGSGWVFTVNGDFSGEYMSSVEPHQGDSIEIYYSPTPM